MGRCESGSEVSHENRCRGAASVDINTWNWAAGQPVWCSRCFCMLGIFTLYFSPRVCLCTCVTEAEWSRACLSLGFTLFLPLGWDKHSYGYHGDDGHSFCCSGTGHPYGPTFTTGDVIGCCVNLINNTCFYTKNGHSLGEHTTTTTTTTTMQMDGDSVHQQPTPLLKYSIENSKNKGGIKGFRF